MQESLTRNGRSIARTLTWVGGASILAMTVVVIGVFYAFAAKQHRQEAARYAQAKAQGAAHAVDVFDATMKVTAQNAHGAFRKLYAPTMVLLNAAEGTLTSYGTAVNGNTTEVDRFAHDFPGSSAAIYAATGDDFRIITSSIKTASGERVLGELLPPGSSAYEAVRAGRRYVGRPAGGLPMMAVYDPIKDDAGTIIGVSYVAIDIAEQQAKLAEMVNSTKLFESGGLYVVRPGSNADDATIVFHREHAGKSLGEVTSKASSAWPRRLVAANPSDLLVDVPALIEPQQPGHRFASVSRSEANGWIVVAEIRESEALEALYRQVLMLAAFIVAAGMLLAVGLIAFMRRAVSPLQGLSLQVETIGRGNLSRSLTSSREDEIGAITRAVETMRNGLDRSLRAVQQATDNIRTASGEIAAGNVDLSTRTEQTASQLQQAASAMGQLTEAIRLSADAAAQANELAVSAFDVASRGGRLVTEVVSTMDDVNASSRKIAEIVGVIDGIAFQTNILALNAAVEAARAGDQGRGFAVVASEVRGLAQRSALAAKEIKELIDASVEKVETGTSLVNRAGSTMEEIVVSVQRVTSIIGEISTASAAQSSGIGQVSVAVSQVEEMTQRNAALVEQSAAAAGSLKEQAHRLAEVAGAFVLAVRPPH